MDLEKSIETLRADLNKKIQLIEANKYINPFLLRLITKAKSKFYYYHYYRKEKEHLELRFEQFRIECEHELHDKFKEQFEAELNEKLDQVITSFTLIFFSTLICLFITNIFVQTFEYI